MFKFRSHKGGRETGEHRHCRHCLWPFKPHRLGIECHSTSCRSLQDRHGRRSPRFFFAEKLDAWRDGDVVLRDVACPSCRKVGTLVSVCPHCRQRLGVDEGDDHVLAVIGASASGKSTFLAAVLHRLLDDEVGGDWEVDLEEHELRGYREQYLAPLFDDRRVLPATPPRLVDEVRLPLHHRGDGRRVLLVFRDLGGEIFADPKQLARISFLRYARGVVLMADPLAYEPPPDDGALWSLNHQPDATRILKTYRDVMEDRERRVEEKALPLRPKEKYLAVAVTKADLVLPDGDPFWAKQGNGSHLERGYWQQREERSGEVAAWVEEHLGGSLARATEAFAETSWFFVSSIGYRLAPGTQALPRPPEPRRVHEPIFALLDRLTADRPAVVKSRTPSEAEASPAAAPAPAADAWEI